MQKQDLHKLSLIFAAIGLAVSIYLTILHYGGGQAACPETGVVNCEKVLTSQYSSIIGIPLAVLGVVFFAAELVVILFLKNNDYFTILSGIGLAVVFYAWYAEYTLQSICLYCTAVHICTIALLIIAIMQSRK